MNVSFDSWLANERAEGLVDIKFAVLNGKGVSLEAVQSEVLSAEMFVKAGLVRPAPTATSMMPESIAAFVSAVH